MAPSYAAARPTRSSWLVPAVVLTFLPFLWKAVEYALIGSYIPLSAFLVLASINAAGVYVGGAWLRRAIRIWCAAMVMWGFARIILEVLIVAADLSEAHLRAQLNVMFNAVSIGYVLAGIALWRRAQIVVQQADQAHSNEALRLT